MTRDEQHRDLLARHRAGDARAMTELCRVCLPFVRWVAGHYRSPREQHEDLESAGWVGFMEGVVRFDLEADATFLTYVGFWVRAEITALLTRGVNTRGGKRAYWNAHRASGRTDEEVAEELGVTVSDVAAARMARGWHDDLDSVAHHPGETSDPDGGLDLQHAVADMLDALAALPPRERMVLEENIMRHDATPLTEIAAMIGVSKQRVHQIRDKALEHMKEVLREHR